MTPPTGARIVSARNTGTALLAAMALSLVVFALAWHPATTSPLLLVADLRGDSLVVVDPTSPEDAVRIELPGAPHELVQLADGRIVASLEQAGTLAIVDLASGNVEIVPVGGVPHGLAVDGRTVLVTDRAVGLIRRFDSTTWAEVGTIPVGAWPHSVAVTPSGELAVASARPGIVTVGDVTIPVGGSTETLATRHDGALAAAAAVDGVVVLLTGDGRVVGTWEVGGRPVRVVFSPDGETLAVALSAGHAVALIHDDAVRYVTVPGVPDGLAFSSDGTTLFVSDVAGGYVTAVDTQSGILRAILDTGEATGALMVLSR